MKIIDILNKMANGELEDGFKFKYKHATYTYQKEENRIVDSERDTLGGNYFLEQILNDKVEVIEENKEIEELKTLSPQSETYKSVVDNREKINELVRAVNKLNKESK